MAKFITCEASDIEGHIGQIGINLDHVIRVVHHSGGGDVPPHLQVYMIGFCLGQTGGQVPYSCNIFNAKDCLRLTKAIEENR